MREALSGLRTVLPDCSAPLAAVVSDIFTIADIGAAQEDRLAVLPLEVPAMNVGGVRVEDLQQVGPRRSVQLMLDVPLNDLMLSS